MTVFAVLAGGLAWFATSILVAISLGAMMRNTDSGPSPLDEGQPPTE